MTDSPASAFAQYAHPERLVTTDWLAAKIEAGEVGGPDGVVVLESDEDVLLYDTGHIPGALKLDWHQDLNDPVMRDYVDAEQFAAVMSARGSAAIPPSSSTATRTTGGRPMRCG